MAFNFNETALLLIDIQKGLDDWAYYGGERNNLDAEANASKILARFRELKLPVFHIQHSSQNESSPLHVSKPGFQLKDNVKPLPSEPHFVKTVNSAFIGTPLESALKKEEIKALTIVGLTTNHCISTSVRMAANLGFEVILISDATACFNGCGADGKAYDAELMHQVSLASLKDEFAQILTTKHFLDLL